MLADLAAEFAGHRWSDRWGAPRLSQFGLHWDAKRSTLIGAFARLRLPRPLPGERP